MNTRYKTKVMSTRINGHNAEVKRYYDGVYINYSIEIKDVAYLEFSMGKDKEEPFDCFYKVPNIYGIKGIYINWFTINEKADIETATKLVSYTIKKAITHYKDNFAVYGYIPPNYAKNIMDVLFNPKFESKYKNITLIKDGVYIFSGISKDNCDYEDIISKLENGKESFYGINLLVT